MTCGAWPYGFWRLEEVCCWDACLPNGGALEEVCGCDEEPFGGCEFDGCTACSRKFLPITSNLLIVLCIILIFFSAALDQSSRAGHLNGGRAYIWPCSTLNWKLVNLYDTLKYLQVLQIINSCKYII